MATLLLILLSLALSTPAYAGTPFVVRYDWTDNFRIYGHLPVPQVNGFDYYFTPEKVAPLLQGLMVEIHSVEVEAYGNNIGEVICFDWEVHLNDTPIGLPEGQFIEAHVDPIAGYERVAKSQFRFIIGCQPDTESYMFRGGYDFRSGSASAEPYLGQVRVAFTDRLFLRDGLHAQLFLWTADNRNCQIEFEPVSLVVRGEIVTSPPISSIFWQPLWWMFTPIAGGRPPYPTIEVPGISDIMLADKPAGTCIGNDCAPQNSPPSVQILESPGAFSFLVTGVTSECCNESGPDGDHGRFFQMDGSFGLSDVVAPLSSTLAVFLGPDPPDPSLTPPPLDFSDTEIGTQFLELAPELQQVFFVGDGRTQGGEVQIFHIPEGATRLYFGVLDLAGYCYDNTGMLAVTISLP